MAADSVLVPEAEADIAEAYAWYEARRVGLGEDFLGAVDALIEMILRHPETPAIVYRVYRRGLVRRFPYAVIYESSGNTVTLHGVVHTAQDPKRWQQRLS